MSIRLCSLVVIVATVVALGCESRVQQPAGPSALQTAAPTALAATPSHQSADREQQHVIGLFDACDPETFNAALGPGTCVRSGGIVFNKFLELLRRNGSVGPWHFAPTTTTMRVGQLLVADNRGGETHTFTEVEDFGGGIVPILNQLTGLTTVAPECQQLAQGDFLAPGASSSEEEEEVGIEKYQCCIHPWMRAEIRITEK
jgi:hypothetical protein